MPGFVNVDWYYGIAYYEFTGADFLTFTEFRVKLHIVVKIYAVIQVLLIYHIIHICLLFEKKCNTKYKAHRRYT